MFRLISKANPSTPIIFLLLFSQSSAIALDSKKAITQYVHDTWTIEEGLPENSIFSIVQTRDGYLWFATADGMARFDGIRFTVFNKKNAPILENTLITALRETTDGTLWIGTLGGGVYTVKNGHWKRFSEEQGIPRLTILALTEDSQGNMWIGTIGGGLHKYSDGKMTHYGKEQGLLNDAVSALFEDRKGNLWIATAGGLNCLTDGKFISYTTKDGLSLNNISALNEDHQGNLWVGTNGGGLNKLKDGKFTSYTTKDGLLNDSVNTIQEDADGNLWIGTSGGLTRLKDGTFANFTEKDGLTNSTVSALFEDSEHNLWVGTNMGLNRLRDGIFTAYTSKEGVLSDSVWSVAEDHEQNLWVGTSAGAYRLGDSGPLTLTSKDGLSANYVNCIFVDRENNLWMGTEDNGLNLLSRGKLSLYNEKNGLAGNSVFAIYEDKSGNLWVGTSGGLTRFRDGALTSYTTKDGLSPGQVRSIAEDREGNLWIGTLGGLTRMRNGKLSTMTEKNGLLNEVVLSLYLDQQGDLWIGTLGGLNRLRNGQLKGLNSQNGLFSDGIGNMIEDNNGNFWICGQGGIFSVGKKDLNDFADGKLERFHSTSYGKPDGLKARGCKGAIQPSSWKTNDGKLWFCSDLGIVVLSPENNYTNQASPPVIIEGIAADDEVLYSYSVQPGDTRKNEISIAPGKERLEFRYTALSFAIPERLRFQFMLEGFDRKWIDAGAKRYGDYTNLRPGHYRFKVRAANENGIWNDAGDSAAFYLEPHFYQTFWFYGLCAFAAVGFIAGSYRLRVRQLNHRQKELVAAVEKGTADLREASKRLQEAEERIRQMAESGPQALENLPVWSKIVAEDVAKIIGAEEIDIWKVEDQQVIPLIPVKSDPPSLDLIRRAASDGSPEIRGILPVKGLSGEIYGALVIQGKESNTWKDPERHLLAGFAHQLGGALEMERMRNRLAVAEMRKAATIQEMKDQGIAILGICPACKRCYDQQDETCEMDGAVLITTRVLPYKIAGRYRLARLIGEGGMGIVFQAEDEKLQREVSIKIIHQERINNPITRIRLKREAQVLAHIQDPGVIQVYDFGELPDGSAFIVMEFLNGKDVAEILKRDGPGTPQQVATLLLQIGEALHSTHSKGVIHRDLKPSNLLIVAPTNSFQTKILDFGLAKSVTEDVSLTSTGMVVGTPSYMSPEQARDQILGEESDLFSLAALTYELLTGRRPFYGSNTVEVLSKVVSETPASISSWLKDSPRALDQLFFSALAKDPEDRPRSILQWTRQVAALLQKIPPSVSGWKLVS